MKMERRAGGSNRRWLRDGARGVRAFFFRKRGRRESKVE